MIPYLIQHYNLCFCHDGSRRLPSQLEIYTLEHQYKLCDMYHALLTQTICMFTWKKVPATIVCSSEQIELPD